MAALPDNITPLSGWGATVDEWANFDLILGLTRDLLPVVSNIRAIVSPRSALQDIGKVPSIYNGDRQVAGLAGWTKRVTRGAEIDTWSRQRDYGICVQTRYVRGLDVDIPDPSDAQAVRIFVVDWLARHGITLPERTRSNASKFLMPFVLMTDDFSPFPKRIVRTKTGLIEVLGDGQQFIAVGTHPSGVRYEWSGGVPGEIPVIDEPVFEMLWTDVVARFGIDAPVTMGASRGVTAARTGLVRDAMFDYLESAGMVKSIDSVGRVAIVCPFEDEHSEPGEGADSATIYFPAGTGGYAQGHFKCLHAHCAHRSDPDFVEATGMVAAQFAALPAMTQQEQEQEDKNTAFPTFVRDKFGAVIATIDNTFMAVGCAQMSGVRIGRDTFRDAVMLTHDLTGTAGWREFSDTDYTEVRIALEKHYEFKPVSREMARDAVALVAERLQFDSAQLRLAGLTWDGVPRCEAFLTTYLGAASNAYTRSVALYMWSALAGRILQPGVKADMVPVLIGGQGIQKSSVVSAIAFTTDEFVEMDLGTKDDDIARMLRGVSVVELAELKGIGAREQEHVKALITKTADKWIPKFMECSHTNARRNLFIGTSNRPDFLTDSTGNRRWLPVEVYQGDSTGVARDREQLWAEAAVLFVANGVMWRDAERLAKDVHAAHMLVDVWQEPIATWLATVNDDGVANGNTRFSTNSVIAGALGISTERARQDMSRRVGDVLRGLDYAYKGRRNAAGVLVKCWEAVMLPRVT